jgi:hypothetical protein
MRSLLSVVVPSSLVCAVINCQAREAAVSTALDGGDDTGWIADVGAADAACDRSCRTDSDCIPVGEGETCNDQCAMGHGRATCDAPDAIATGCTAARALLWCGYDGGEHQNCLSNDLRSCPTPLLHGSCTNQCQASEYAVACGGPGLMAEQGGPPPSCRSVDITPGGVSFYCCPCIM